MVNEKTKPLMKTPMSAISNVVEILLRTEASKATKYLSETQIVRATRRSNSGKNTEINLTLGRPNFEEREFVKKCKKAGEPMPIKKVQLKFPTVKKAKKVTSSKSK